MINKEKLFLIIKREYLTRLKSKVFIITTVLAPIGMILLLVLPGLIQTMSSDRQRQYFVYDETQEVGQRLVKEDSLSYSLSDYNPDELREKLMRGTIEGFIVIPHEILDGEGETAFYHDGTAGMTTTSRVRSDLQRIVREVRLDRLEAPEEIRVVMTESINMENLTITDDGKEEADTGFFVFVGIIMGFIIYGAMFAYGAVIMRSVMEEKTSRIVEVIASSVKPFELLLGKVIGVGALGLTQFAIWSAAGAILLAVAGPLVGLFAGGGAEVPETAGNGAEAAAFSLPSIGPMLWIGFVLFFLLGFLIYSSLFAAVGSAVDQESDSQQLQMPIILLIIIPLLFLVTVSDDPGSNMAVALSMFPFFAPILMPVRMSVISVPLWQVIGTIFLMIITFLILIWVSARIYRVGILMYGKKASFRELLIWIRQN